MVGINNELEGILEHDKTYFATITCTNAAGRTSIYTDIKGRVATLFLHLSLSSIIFIAMDAFISFLYN